MLRQVVCVSIFISSFANAGLAIPSLKWTKTEVSVCFAEKDQLKYSRLLKRESGTDLIAIKLQKTKLHSASLEQKRLISIEIQKEYTKARTKIHFVGWKNCVSDDTADVFIFTGDTEDADFSGDATIGAYGDYDQKSGEILHDTSGAKPFVFLSIDSFLKSEVLKDNAIHEFAHIAGLLHEMIRPEMLEENDPYCAEYPPFKIGIPKDAINLSAYDSHSVTSYCFMDYYFDSIAHPDNSSLERFSSFGLSSLDQESLLSLYSKTR